METTTIAELVNELNAVAAQRDAAFAACRSIRFATDNAARHGGDYSLNDLLAADKLAKQALTTGAPKMRLSAADRRALSLVGDGCDVTAPDLAMRLRSIQKRYPSLLWIGNPMGIYAAGTHHPYFGAKLTAAGKHAIATKKGGAQ